MTTPFPDNDHDRIVDATKRRAMELRRQAIRESNSKWLLVPVLVALTPLFATLVIGKPPAPDPVLVKVASPAHTKVASGK